MDTLLGREILHQERPLLLGPGTPETRTLQLVLAARIALFTTKIRFGAHTEPLSEITLMAFTHGMACFLQA